MALQQSFAQWMPLEPKVRDADRCGSMRIGAGRGTHCADWPHVDHCAIWIGDRARRWAKDWVFRSTLI